MTTDKTERKQMPIAKGCLDYFPDALAEVAHVSYVGNAQHNPGQEMHWDKSKSPDHADCIARHLLERGTLDDDGLRHSAKVAWRALAMLQIEIEREQAATKIWEAGYADKTRQNYIPQLLKLGCSEEVCKQVFGGLTYSVANVSPKGLLYVAGPMRKIKDYNFPMFDRARDAALAQGWDVISPADIDRTSPFTQADLDNQAVFVLRDFWSLFLVAHNQAGKGILMLPGWDMSRGAAAECHLAHWLRIPIYAYDAVHNSFQEIVRGA